MLAVLVVLQSEAVLLIALTPLIPIPPFHKIDKNLLPILYIGYSKKKLSVIFLLTGFFTHPYFLKVPSALRLSLSSAYALPSEPAGNLPADADGCHHG